MARRGSAMLVVAGGLALFGSAEAQDLRDIQARNAAAHALEDIRRDALQSQIEASNARERARTTLRRFLFGMLQNARDGSKDESQAQVPHQDGADLQPESVQEVMIPQQQPPPNPPPSTTTSTPIRES